jgi:hypothetical protein
MWTEIPKGKNKKPVNKDRFISKMFLRCAVKDSLLHYLTADNNHRGDSVILGNIACSLSKMLV